MGIALPDSGLLYLDANCFIYSVERIKPYHTLLQHVWNYTKPPQAIIVTSELTLLEVLVKPLREGDIAGQTEFRTLLLQTEDVQVLPITQAILLRAAELRATTAKLKTPDAIHIATALETGCSLFVTNDVDLRKIPNLPVALITELGDVTP